MAATSGVAHVDRYWQFVETKPWHEHVYVMLLGLKTYDAASLHARLEEGLSYRTLERLQRVLDAPLARISELIRIPPRTLARRRDAGRLQPDESDRLVRLSRIVGLALRLFEGDLEAARGWLGSPHRALAGQSPLDFATSEVGAREVEHVIGRIEHGIPL